MTWFYARFSSQLINLIFCEPGSGDRGRRAQSDGVFLFERVESGRLRADFGSLPSNELRRPYLMRF